MGCDGSGRGPPIGAGRGGKLPGRCGGRAPMPGAAGAAGAPGRAPRPAGSDCLSVPATRRARSVPRSHEHGPARRRGRRLSGLRIFDAQPDRRRHDASGRRRHDRPRRRRLASRASRRGRVPVLLQVLRRQVQARAQQPPVLLISTGASTTGESTTAMGSGDATGSGSATVTSGPTSCGVGTCATSPTSASTAGSASSSGGGAAGLAVFTRRGGGNAAAGGRCGSGALAAGFRPGQRPACRRTTRSTAR